MLSSELLNVTTFWLWASLVMPIGYPRDRFFFYPTLALMMDPYIISWSDSRDDALPRVLGRREKGIYFRETGEQMPNFDGTRETRTIFGNREHKKTNYRLSGNRQQPIRRSISALEQVAPPLPWEGLSNTIVLVPLQEMNYV